MYTAMILIIFLFLIAVSSDYKYEYDKNVILDKKLTSQLKGIAIIFVLIGHMTIMNFLNNYKAFQNFGSFGVDIFLILSGYGLYKSYVKKGISKDFVIKRISTIYIPFIIVVLIEIPFKTYKQNYYFSYKQILTFLTGFDIKVTLDATLWYISFILLWYLIFCIIYRHSKYKKLNILLLFYFSYLFELSKFIPGTLCWEYSLHYITFPVGVLIATYEKEFIKLVEFNVNKLIIIILFISSLYIHYIFRSNGNYYWLYDLNIALLIIFIGTLLQSLNIMSRFLKFTGEIAFEIYLVENEFMTYYNFPKIIGNRILGNILEILSCYIIGFLLNRLVKVTKKLVFYKIA